MKTKFTFYKKLILIGSLALFILPLGTVSAQGPNLISNPGFEEDPAAIAPWGTWGGNNLNAARVRTGVVALNQWGEGAVTQTVSSGVVAGDSYTLSAWAVFGDVATTATLSVQCFDASNTSIATFNAPFIVNTVDFKQTTLNFTAPAGTATMFVYPYFNGAGILDDVSLTNNSVLPVSFISFDLKLNNNGTVDLTWLTESEKNNSHFIVLKSVDGVNFNKLAKISGSGNSNQTNRYQTVDSNPANGNNYYQLVQYDADGKAKVLDTKIVNTNLNSDNSVAVFPNPSQDVVNIKLESGSFQTVKLIDLNGKMLISKPININQNQISLDIQGLVAGTYVILMDGKTGIASKQIVKN